MKVLLIWDSCGQNDPELFFITGDSAKIVLAANGQYINSSDNTDAVEKVNTLLESNSGDIEIVDCTEPGTYDAISVCGFMP